LGTIIPEHGDILRHAQALLAYESLVAPSLATFATATVSSSTAVAASAATAGWSRFPRPSLVHRQRPAFNGLAIEFRDGVLSVLVGAHGDKRKAPRFAGEFVLHKGNFLHSTGLCEKLLEFVFRRVEGKIAYV
jgi:hypothetical protein